MLQPNPSVEKALLIYEACHDLPQDEPSPVKPCPVTDPIFLGLFFDGTDNNMYWNKEREQGTDTNITKMYDLYDAPGANRTKYYYEGVGSPWYAVLPGIIAGLGGHARVEKAYRQVTDFCTRHPCAPKQVIDVFGFSRGAALARHFVNVIRELGVPGTTESSLEVRFLGIYDTVGSFWVPGDNSDPGYNFAVDSHFVTYVAHYIAAHEYRALYDLHSIRTGPGAPLPANMEEKRYPGAHADVGGGYAHRPASPFMNANGVMMIMPEKSNALARIPLRDMVKMAQAKGVKFLEMSARPDYERRFKIPERLLELYKTRTNPQAFQKLQEGYIHDERLLPGQYKRTIFYPNAK